MSESLLETHQKTRLQQLRRLRSHESLINKGARRNCGNVTAPHRNRDRSKNKASCNRMRGYASERLQIRGYAQSLIHKGIAGCVTAVTAVTAKKYDVRNVRGGAR